MFDFFFIFPLLTMGKYFKERGEKMGKESLPTQLILKWKRKKQKKCYIFFPFCGKLMKEKNLFWYIAKPNAFIQESITLYCFSFFGEGSVTL